MSAVTVAANAAAGRRRFEVAECLARRAAAWRPRRCACGERVTEIEGGLWVDELARVACPGGGMHVGRPAGARR